MSNFFPRYLKILSSDKYKNSIAEIRIEGYASSLWQIAHSEQEVYLNNMKLSQGRAFSILQYLYQLPDARNFTKFLNDKLTANGMSYSHKVQTNNGVEDTMSSQRIEFKVNLNTDNQVINNLIMSKGS